MKEKLIEILVIFKNTIFNRPMATVIHSDSRFFGRFIFYFPNLNGLTYQLFHSIDRKLLTKPKY